MIAIAVHGQSAPSAREQTVFDENTSIQHPVPLPRDALKALLGRKEVRDNLQEMAAQDRKNVAEFFTASEVHLVAANHTDLVVMGKCPMSGADNTWFWVIRSARKHPLVALFAGGYSLELLTRRTKGYRDVRCTWSSPQETSTKMYSFDGSRYKLRKETWRKNYITSTTLEQASSKEHIAFLSEDLFPPSAPLPYTVLQLLLKDQSVKDSIQLASDEERKNPAQLFRAAEVHLFSPKEADLLIVGNLPIAGADNGWFWVVRSAHKNPRIVLFTTGYAVEVMRSRTNGYFNLRSTWSNPSGIETRIYRFDGARYRLRKESWLENH
ncbi:MAG TPA: hypothetical protein VNB54_13765 [Alphaproteobacteria bacterium]|nr:hypothetical protein [Alphaproteobacteria bacterium]